jgi:hypothetical protein
VDAVVVAAAAAVVAPHVAFAFVDAGSSVDATESFFFDAAESFCVVAVESFCVVAAESIDAAFALLCLFDA